MSRAEGNSLPQRKYGFDGKHSIIDELGESDPDMTKKNKPRDIDAPFDLEEDLDKPLEKYGDDFDLSDDENNDEVEEAKEEIYKSSKVVPHSMPMNIALEIDPFTQKPRTPIGKDDIGDEIPNGSIYENMQVLSRSIQSSDYRNRVWGTKPDEDSRGNTYSQSYHYHGGITRPRGIICSQPAQRVNISEETLEESPSLETPK